jgi:hypothetical protein
MPALFHLHLHYLVLSLLAGVQIGPAAPSQQPAPAVVKAPAPDSGTPTSVTPGPVRDALNQGDFPWYDAPSDRVRPVWGPRTSWTESLRTWFNKLGDRLSRAFRWLKFDRLPSFGLRGDWLGMTLLATVLAAFFACLLVLWLRRDPFAVSASAAQASPGSARLLSQLPEEFLPGLDDAWAEAQRRRAAGDLAGAIIYLFAHQLLSLDRSGLIRLAPGWTGRQYVRGLRDPLIGDALASTNCLFEEYFYGHKAPSPHEFDHVWSRAQELEDRRKALEALT